MMDTYRAILTHASHKSLPTLACVSKVMAALVLDEAIKRYFPNKKTYMHESLRGFNVKQLTIQSAYYFLVNPNIGPPKLAHAAASRDPDMIALALRRGATDYFDGCTLAAINGDADAAIMLYELWRKLPPILPESTWSIAGALEEYFDRHLRMLTNSNIADNVPDDIADIISTDMVLAAAYMGGNQTLIDYFTAIEPPSGYFIAFGICRGSRLDLVDWAFDELPDLREEMLMDAGNNMPVVRYLVEKKNVPVTDVIIARAIWRNCKSVDFLMDACPGVLTRSFEAACSCNRLDYVKRSLPGSETLIRTGFKWACYYGCLDVMVFLAGHHKVDWNNALLEACADADEQSEDTIQLCIDNGATNLEAALKLASKASDKRIAHFLVDAMFA